MKELFSFFQFIHLHKNKNRYWNVSNEYQLKRFPFERLESCLERCLSLVLWLSTRKFLEITACSANIASQQIDANANV